MSGPFHGLKPDKAYLCVIPADMIDTEHCERCRMMVAAPQLLAELRWAADFVCDRLCGDPDTHESGQDHAAECTQVRAAIAKAEGK